MLKYKEIGIKLTPQRLEILNYLASHHHPSAEEIYRDVSRKFPTMSFSTVYNTLDLLKRRGKIRELTIDRARKRYDVAERPHHHLLCVACGKIRDIEMDYEPVLPKDRAEGFTLLGNHVEFHGICPECRNGK